MYKLDIYHFPTSNEYEYKFAGNYGAKGERRNPKKRRTPEDIERQNQYQRTKTVRHLIKANFTEGDYYTTLTYRKDESRTIKEIAKDTSQFLGRLRYQYKKHDIPCKYIYRLEIGSRGGLHVHIILNRIPELDKIIQKSWPHGRCHNELLDDGTYEQLADYIVKPPTEEQKRILRNFDEDTKKLIRYSCSRNLVRPVPETKQYTRRTMRSVFNHDLMPEEGFYIDKNSIKSGINAFTGMRYLYYQEIKLKKEQQAEPVKICECPICHQYKFEFLTCDCQRKKRGSQYLRSYNHKSTKPRPRKINISDRVPGTSRQRS